VPELEPRPDHASYTASRLSVLKNEKRFLFSAAAHAQRAVAYLYDLQPMAQQRAAWPRAIDAGNRRICLKATLFGDDAGTML
jgi:antirestriction protein ArdC